MSKNKASILAKLLDKQEVKSLSKLLLKQKKEKQEKLLRLLISSNDYSNEKAMIYQQLYQGTYSKEKDYLLRNDLRKLSTSIIKFIKNEVNGDAAYLNLLRERKANSLFEKEIAKAINKTASTQSETNLQIQKIYFEYWLANCPRKLVSLKSVQAKLLACINNISDDKPVHKSSFIVQLSVLERIIWQHFNEEKPTDLSSIITPKLLQNKTATYLIEKAFSFQLFGLERIKKLENCIKYLQLCSEEFYNDTEFSYLQSQLGLEYFLIPDFIKSKPHFEIAYDNISILSKSQQMQLVYNYSSMLCAAEDFTAANEILNKHVSLFKATPFESTIKLFALMARINSNQLDDLRSLLPPSNEVLAKDVQVYTRIYECIILYYEKEYEVCVSYLENIYNTSRYNSFLDKAFIEFAKLFQRLVSALLLPKSDEKTNKIEGCLTASNAFIDAYELGFGSNMLCSVWLNKTIKEHVKN